MSRFVMKDEVETTTFDWGSAARAEPPRTPGATPTS